MHWIFNTQPWRWSQCISQAHTLTLGREKFTGSCNGESLWQLLHFHLFLPLPLPRRVSHSPNMTHSHVDKVSLTVAAATYRSYASLTPWCPSPRLYLNLISLVANDSMQASHARSSAFGHQEMKTDSHWHRGRQNADALMHPSTPT